jgi:hypothetical protein
MQLPEISTLLKYKNDSLIHYYCHHHSDITKSMANQYFVDLLAWLWLNAYRQHQKKRTYLFGPLLVLDELWHAFILHTRDYHEFCEAFFSSYIHHDIELPGQEHQLSAEEIEDFLEDSFNFLGEAWVLRYFSDLLDEGDTN